MFLLFTYYACLSMGALLFSKPLAKLFLKNQLIFFLSSAVILALPYLFITQGIRDIELMESVGYFSFNRLDIYYYDADHRLYPYLPATSLLTSFLFAISKFLNLPFINLWRLTTLAFLVLTAYLIGKMTLNSKSEDSSLRTILFLFSPMAIWPVIFHAHHDVILLFFYLLSVFLIFKKRKTFLSGISLGFSILAKTWSVVFLPLVFLQKLRKLQKLIITAGMISPIVVISLFYLRFWHSTPTRIWDAVTGYAGSWTVYWGPQGLLVNSLSNNQPLNQTFRSSYLLIIFTGVYLVIFKKGMEIIPGSKFLILTFFVLTISWAPQYIFWIFPFIALGENLKTLKNFSLLGAIYVLTAYASMIWDFKNQTVITLSSLPIWLYSAKLWYTQLRGQDLH